MLIHMYLIRITSRTSGMRTLHSQMMRAHVGLTCTPAPRQASSARAAIEAPRLAQRRVLSMAGYGMTMVASLDLRSLKKKEPVLDPIWLAGDAGPLPKTPR